ncbi:MAG TPA: hydantoinase/oxoprolinase family protein [Acidimicrobiales bacterium]|nr:hydantoinase/oxoprolinase family protein [Acidimicrobiales bacterium]
MRCGADTGGTFTDIVTDDGRIAKVLSTPDDPSRAVSVGLSPFSAGGARPRLLAHGTTVATNALLERRGGRVALVTTAGFADVIEIARQDRPSLYDITVDRPAPLVPRELRFEVGGRLDGGGAEIDGLDPRAVPVLPSGLDAVAVCLLHADLDGCHEQVVADELAERGFDDVSCSSQVSPEFREYERTVTTAVNAYLRPRCRRYLRSLGALADEVVVMTSAGGLLAAEAAADLPVALLLSGPAGGVRAGAAAAAAAGFADAVTFDMGGTSTDVCLVRAGSPEPAAQRVASGFPIRLPAIDIHTIGAGGGSLAGLDAGGALVVGPGSAGADPGPACYGRGGTLPTVTDADLVLGRIPPGLAFGGLDTLDRAAAEAALARAGVTAEGVVAVVDAAMERAVRAVSVERGVDPAGLALVAFGGAGPLHACAVAEGSGIASVVIPPRAGVLSAVGLLCSPRQRDLVRSWPTPGDQAGMDAALGELARLARDALANGGSRDGDGDGVETGVDVTTSLDCRYAGQSHELTVSTVDHFDAEHRRRNGYSRAGTAIEVTALRARARAAAAVDIADLGPPPMARRPVEGPAVVAEADCTVWVPQGWSGRVADDGSWVLTR